MDRRAFLSSATAAFLAAPLAAGAQPAGPAGPAGKIWRIGVIGFAPTTADMAGPDPPYPFIKALLDGLRERGYVYGPHFVTSASRAWSTSWYICRWM